MKKARMISVLLALALLFSCIAGLFIVGAGATEAVETVYYTLGSVELEGATNFATLADALDSVKNTQWAANAALEIRFQGDISGGAQDGLLFGLTTIWREDGTKLPITFRGVDTNMPKDAYIYLDSAGGWYACANDYHFENLTLPVGDQDTSFFAGSGNVSFKDVSFFALDIKIKTAEEQAVEHDHMRRVARVVAERNEADVIPAGDAWYYLIQNDPDVGNSLSWSRRYERPEGDYKHDGDIGGGMYLNACVWYEILTKKSCVGHEWRPDTSYCGYTLEEELVVKLQNAAHYAVLTEYGEDYYDENYNPDLNGDNVLNILNIGSSNGYYYVDELCQMLTYDGFEARVCTAYHSGVYLSEEWSWAKNGTGDYQFRIYEADSTPSDYGIVSAEKSGVGFAHFEEKYDWDSITFYQTSGGFIQYDLCTDSEAKYETALSKCASADDLYDYMRQTNPNARYTWYQVACNPVGYPGPKTAPDAKSGRFFADNCTQAVFSGWPELKDGEKVQTSLTFLEGANYYSSTRNYAAAIGYMEDYTGDAFTHETAAEVKYEETNSYPDIADIRPVDVEASLIINGSGNMFYKAFARIGFAPSDAKVHMKSGYVYCIYGDTATSGTTENYYGDTTLKVSGGTVGNSVYTAYNANFVGDLIVDVSEDDGTTVIGNCVRGLFSTGTADGDIIMTVRGGTIGDEDNEHSFFGGGGCTGEVINTISGGTLYGNYYGCRSSTPAKVTNNFTGGTLNGDFFGGHYQINKIPLINTCFDGGTLNGNFFGGNYSKNAVAGTINNNIKSGTITGYFAGGNRTEGNTGGIITNTISGGTIGAEFYGGHRGVSSTSESITNLVSGGTVTGNFFGGHYGEEATSGPITTTISGGTLASDFYGGHNGKNSTSGVIYNTLSGGTIAGYARAGSFSATGQTVNNGTVQVNGKSVTAAFVNVLSGTNIAGRELSDDGILYSFHGSGYNGTFGHVYNVISGGTFGGRVYGNGATNATGSSTGDVYNYISGSPVFEAVYYGSFPKDNCGNVVTEVSGTPTFNNVFYSMGYDKDAATSEGKTLTTKISGGIFKGATYLSGSILRDRVSNLTISGGAFKTTTYFGCYNGEAAEINATVKGGTFDAYVYGGCPNTSESVNPKKIDITIDSGTFNSVFFGGSRGVRTGDVTVTVNGGTFKGNFATAGWNKDPDGGSGTEQQDEVVTGDVNLKLYGGSFTNIYSGSSTGTVGNVVNYIEDCTISGVFYGGYGGTMASITNTVKGGTFNGASYFGPWGSSGTCGELHNYIYGGTFNTYSYLGGNGKGTGNITNVIGDANGGPTYTNAKTPLNSSGKNQQNLLYCGGARSGSTVGDIHNTFNNGTFRNVYCGSVNGAYNGAVTNIFNGGTYINSITASGYTRNNGKITNTVNGGNFQEYMMFGGRGTVVLPEGSTEQYVVESVIYGGTFKGVWGGGEGTATNRVGDIKTTIYGGTFNNHSASESRQSAFSAGGRGMLMTGTAEAYIYGGTFTGEIIAGATPNSSDDKYKHDDDADAIIYIYGGTFNKPMYANSKWGAFLEGGTIVLNPTESDITLTSTFAPRADFTAAAENLKIVGGTYKILLGTDAYIDATAVEGDVKFEQIDAWKKQVYVELPAAHTATVTASTAESATGGFSYGYENGVITQVKGGVTVTAATMILEDRITVRALFDKAAIDGMESFSFSFTLAGKAFISGTKADLQLWEANENYYYLLLPGIGISQFKDEIALADTDDTWGVTFSIHSLAVEAETAWAENEKAVTLAQALQNFSSVMNGGDVIHAGLAAKEVDTSFVEASREVGGKINVTGKGLVMSNAVGIRIYGTVASLADLQGATVAVDGIDVTELAVIKTADNGEGYDVTMDLYVKAAHMCDQLNLVITDAEGKVCLDLTDSLEAIAASYPDDSVAATQLLIYIQSAVAYKQA